MNIIDIIIIFIILICGVLGFKKGFTRELVSFIGFFLIIILSFYLKNPVSELLYKHLPFISFGGLFKGITVINILVYEILSFFIIVSILLIAFRIILFATKIFEKLLTFTIILGIPSKILGGIIGLFEGVVWSFLIIYILSLPVFNISKINSSKLSDGIIEKTPILSKHTRDFKIVTDEIIRLKEEFKDYNIDSDTFNYNALNTMLEYNIVKVDSVKTLKEKGKIEFNNLDNLIKQYGE